MPVLGVWGSQGDLWHGGHGADAGSILLGFNTQLCLEQVTASVWVSDSLSAESQQQQHPFYRVAGRRT